MTVQNDPLRARIEFTRMMPMWPLHCSTHWMKLTAVGHVLQMINAPEGLAQRMDHSIGIRNEWNAAAIKSYKGKIPTGRARADQHLNCPLMGRSGRAPAPPATNLATGAKDKEHPMSHNLNSTITVTVSISARPRSVSCFG